MLDGIRSTFHSSGGRLGRDAFIEALLCAVVDNGGGGDGDGEHEARTPNIVSQSAGHVAAG